MRHQGNAEQHGVGKGSEWVGGDACTPVRGRQPGVALGAGKVSCEDRPRADMEAPLSQEEERRQEAFAASTQVVVDSEPGVWASK